MSPTPLQHWPVRLRRGIAIGARWTFLPHPANWRQGGEGRRIGHYGVRSMMILPIIAAALLTSRTGQPASSAPYVAAAIHFDGNTYLSINSLSSTDNGALSFSFWAREDNQTGLWGNGFFWLLPKNTSAIKPSAVLSNAPLLWQLFKGPTG